MSQCVKKGCSNEGRLDLYTTEGTWRYRGGSWCSVECLTTTPAAEIASAYPDQAERPVPADA